MGPGKGYGMILDRYVYPGTNVLVNKFGITDLGKLSGVERMSSAANAMLLMREGVTGRFDRQHIQDIHRRIFGDVYGWAGEFRDIRIWKGSGTEFVAPGGIEAEIDGLCGRIRDAGYFQGLDHDGAANAFADVMADLNGIHPFREGNGRTQRAFIGQLALNAGYDLDFTKMSENDMRNASMAAAHGNRNLMRYLFRDAMSERIYEPGPVRGNALHEEHAPRRQGAFSRPMALLGKVDRKDDGLDGHAL